MRGKLKPEGTLLDVIGHTNEVNQCNSREKHDDLTVFRILGERNGGMDTMRLEGNTYLMPKQRGVEGQTVIESESS